MIEKVEVVIFLLKVDQWKFSFFSHMIEWFIHEWKWFYLKMINLKSGDWIELLDDKKTFVWERKWIYIKQISQINLYLVKIISQTVINILKNCFLLIMFFSIWKVIYMCDQNIFWESSIVWKSLEEIEDVQSSLYYFFSKVVLFIHFS